MSLVEDSKNDKNTQYAHRKQCSVRIFVGPWDLSSHAEQMPEEINELSVALPEPEPNNTRYNNT